MTSPIGSPLIASTTASAAPADASARDRLAEVAKQFEGIFLRQMLAAARKTNFGDSMFGSEAMGTFRQMQDERFADIAADTGAFGLAKMIEVHLARFVPAEAPADGANMNQEAAGHGI